MTNFLNNSSLHDFGCEVTTFDRTERPEKSNAPSVVQGNVEEGKKDCSLRLPYLLQLLAYSKG